MLFLNRLVSNQTAWFMLALTALFLELSALFFQYGLKLDPCIMCIYQRVTIWGLFFAGLVGAYTHQYLFGRIAAFTLWGLGAFWGLQLSLEHHEIQTSTMSFLFSCEFVPNFPSWLPLHEWLPFLFEASGDCGDIDWQFMGFTMPQVMILIFTLYSMSLIGILISRLMVKKSL